MAGHFRQIILVRSGAELIERFGGVTAFVRAPAVGLWKENAEDINRDEVVMFEGCRMILINNGGPAIANNSKNNFVRIKF